MKQFAQLCILSFLWTLVGGLSITVMIFGWGLYPTNWWIVIGGFLAFSLVSGLIGIIKEF